MAQLLLCDLCKEIIKLRDKKYIFGLYCVTEEDEETRKIRFEELVKDIYEGKCHSNNNIKIAEICEKCVGVFAHFMNLRKKELIKSRKEVKKILSRKVRTEKKKELAEQKEEKKKRG